MPMNADLRALWDERYVAEEAARYRPPSAIYDYVIAAGLIVSGLSLAIGSIQL